MTAIHDAPDGRNINLACGALHPEGMARATRESGVALGVAFDGDADRSIFADETGRILDGDDVLWIIARDWKARGLPDRRAASSARSCPTSGSRRRSRRRASPSAASAVGDRNVARHDGRDRRRRSAARRPGHVLLAPLSPAGDGILTALVLSAIVRASGRKLSELATLEKMPQTLRNVRVAPPRARSRSRRGHRRRRVGRAEEALRGAGPRLPPLLRDRAPPAHPRRGPGGRRGQGHRRRARGDRARAGSDVKGVRAVLFDAGGTLIHVDGERVCRRGRA